MTINPSTSQMLEHQKIVLKGVQLDKDLFQKELKKTLQWLEGNQLNEFNEWLRKNFMPLHKQLIEESLRA